MNKTYRVVYNETTRTYTAVAEIATARGKSAGVVDGTVSAQTTVRKPKGRMIAGWTLGAALLNFSMMFGFTMLPAAEVVAATCVMNGTTNPVTSVANNSLACGAQATTGSLLNSTAIGYQAKASTDNATAIGSQTVSNGSGNVAAGFKANADGAWSTAVGGESRTVDGGGTATGYAAVASKDSTAIGALASAGYDPARNQNSGLITNLGNKTGGQSVALGYKAKASGDQSLAIGGDTVASGAASVAIGGDDLDGLAGNAGLQDTFTKLSGEALNVGTYKGTTSSGAGSVAMGVQAESGGAFATTVGTRSVASGAAATAMGVASTAAGSAAFAGAAGSKALGNNSVAVGAQADATALNAIAIGQASQATASNATALGSEALATAAGANALGLNAKAQAENGVALGVRANVATTGIKGVAIGEDANSSNEKSIAIGAASKSSGDKSIAVGDSANATNTHSFAMGGQSLSTGTNALAIGSNTKATGNFSIAQGNAANATSLHAQAMGVEAVASANYTTAIGSKATASAVNSFAGGREATASGNQAVALGNKAAASGGSAVAIGNESVASKNNAVATGWRAQATGDNAVALGREAKAESLMSLALGNNANASLDRSVALGAYSTVSGAVQTNSATVGGINYSGFAGSTPAEGDVVSVGEAAGRKRQIQNVAAGQISTTSTDAINGSQLYATNSVLSTLANSVKTEFGGDAALNPNTGEITFSNIGNTDKDTIHDAIAAVKENVVAGTNIVSVTSQADTTTGATTYTVNAKGTTASSANQNFVTVTPGQPNAENITDYAVDLSDAAKASLAKADTAVQNITSPDGSVVVTQDPANPNTTNLQVKRGLGITLDSTGGLTVATTKLDQNATNMRFGTPRGQQNSFVKADDLARHLNNVGFNLSGEEMGGTFEDLTTDVSERQIRNGDVLNIYAGPNMKINQVRQGYEFSIEGENVAYAGNKATVPTTDDGSVATVKSVAEAINHSGFTLKTSATTDGQKLGGADEVINPADTVDMTAGKNLTVKQEANGKITYATKENVEFTSVKAGPVTINNNGINAGNTQITNMASGGDVNTNAANIGDVKKAKTEVVKGTNIVDVAKTEGADGQSIYTVNAKGTTASSANEDYVTVKVGTPNGENVTDYAVDLSEKAKESLNKADTAVQSFTTSVNGAQAEQIDQANKDVNFVNGTGTTARNVGGDITFDVNKSGLTTDDKGNVTANNTTGDNFATAEDVANAINEATARTEKTTSVVKGSNTHVQEKVNGNNTEYTVSADKTTVSTGSALKLTKVDAAPDANEAVTTDYNIDLSDETKKQIAKEESVVQGDNVTVTEDGTNSTGGKQFKVALNKTVDLTDTGSVTTGNTTVNNDGVKVGDTTLTNAPITVNGNTVNNVNEAINKTAEQAFNPLTFAGDSGTEFNRKLGEKVNVKGGADTAKLSDGNIGVVANGADTLEVKLSKELKDLTSAEFKDPAGNTTVVNGAGTTITPANGNPVSLTTTGLNNGGNQITNVASGGDVDTNAANIADVKKAKTEVVKGTNIVDVAKTTGANGQDVYTVNAKGTTASSANQDYVTVKAGTPNGENVTDYAVDLSEKAKESLSKADTAVQSFTTSVNGTQAEELNQANKDVNFVNGTGTTARNVGGDITFDVNKAALTTDTAGNVTNNNAGDTFVTGDDVAKAINEATARTEKTTSVVKGSNTHVQEKVNGNNTEYTVSADKATVSVSSALTKTETPTTDATTGAVTTDYALDLSQTTKDDIKKGVDAKDIVDNKGLTFTGDSGSTNVEKLGSTVAVKGDSNITTAASGDEISIKLNENITVNNVTTNGLTVNPNGNVDMGGNTITNVGSGGTTGTNAANIDDVKNAATKVTSNDGSIKVASSTSGLQTTYDISVPTTALTTNKGTVNTPAEPNSYVTAGNLATTINTAVASAKEKVEAGTNIVSVDSKVDDTTGATTYTVNAKGTTASVAQGDKYLTVSESPKDGNVTDYQFGLTQSAKDSLFKADTALQSFTTSVNGTPVETINQENSDVGFVNGNVTTAAQSGRDITFDVNFDDKTLKQDGNKLAVNTTTLTPSETDGTVTAGNPDNLATAGDIANAINKAGFKLTASKSEGEVSGETEELVNAGETVTVDAGKNIKLTQAAGKITVATKDDVEFNNVTVNGDVTAGDTVLNKDGLTINNGNTDNKPVTLTKDGLDNGGNTITNVARGEADTDAVNVSQLKEVSNVANAGWNLTAQGENSSNVAANDTVDLNNTDGNIVVSKEADKDDVTFNLAKDIKVDSVTIENGNAGKPVTLGKDGLDNGGNKVTNVADGDVTADSQDAVNGSQLFNNAQSIANNLGGGSTVNNDGTVSAPTYTVTNPADGSNSQVNNVGDAVNALNNAVNSPLTFAGDSGNNVERKLGTTLNVKGGATGNLTDNNIAVVADGTDTLNIKLAEKVNLGENGEVKAGDTTVNNDGVKVGDNVALNSDGLKAGDVSVTTEGINAGDKVISNVAEGKAPTDAVNVSQLEKAAASSKEVVESKDKSVTVKASKNPDTEATTFDLSVNVDGTTITKGDNGELKANTTTLIPSETDGTVTAGNPDNLATAGDIANAINKAGFKLTATASEGEVAGTSPELVNAGETVTIDAGKNIKLTQAAGKITVATKDDVEFNNVTVNGDVKAGDTVLNKDGVKNGDTSLTKDGITVNNGTAGEPVTLTKDGLNNGGNKVTNVADGDINADSKDAVNGSQLHDIIEKGFKIAADQGSDDTVKLGETVAYRSESGNIVTKVSDNKIDFDLADKITVGNNTANPVTIDGTAGTVTGLSNKTWDPNNIVSGQAATEDQLKQVSDVANAGWNLTANDANSSNVAAGETVDLNNTDGNIDISKKADEDKVTFNLAKDITVDSVTAGDSKLTSDGLTINNGTAGNPVKLTKDGLDNGGNKVTNVADGTENSDAVNLSQLKEAKEVVKSEDKSVTVNTTQNNDGANVFDLSVNVDGTTITKGDNGELKANTTTLTPSETDGTVTAGNPDNLATAGDIANAINKAGFKLTATASEGEVAGTSPELVNAGETVTIDAGKNIKLTQAAGKITVATKDDVTFNNVTVNGDVKAGETTLNNDGVKVGDTTLTKAPITVNGNTVNNVNDAINQTAAQAFSPLTFAGDSGNNVERKLGTTLNVKGGATGNLTDNNIAVVANGTDTLDIKLAEKVDLGEKGEVKAGDTTVNNDGVKVGDNVALTSDGLKAGDVSVTDKGLDNGGNQIKNVAAGTEDTDGVNVSQLKAAQAAATTKVEGTEGVEVTSSENADKSTTYTVKAKTDGITTKLDDAGNITANTTKLENSDKGTVNTPENPDALATAGDIANAINNAGFNVKSGGNKADGDEAAAELVKAGEEVELNAGKNLKVKRTGKVFTFETADDVVFNNVTVAGDLTAGDTVLNKDGITIKNGNTDNKPVTLTKDGLDNGGNKITNVAAGKDDTDAVNVSQLKDAQAAATTKVVEGDNIVVTPETNADGSTTYKVETAKEVKFDSVTTGDTVMNNDGVKVGDTTLTKTPITVNGNTVNNVNDAINQTAAQAFSPLTFAGDSGNNVERKLGTTLNVKGGATGNLTDNNIAVVANGTDTLDIKLAEKVDLGENGEVKAGDTTVNNDGVKVGDNVALTSDGLKAGDVSVTDKGLDNGNNQIKNVAAGTEDTDGVNVSQLKAAQAAATTKVVEGDNMVVTSKTNGDGSTTYTVATAKEVKFDKVTTGDTVMNNDGVTVGDNVALNSDGLKAGDVSVTDKGLDNGGNQIKNVAAGTENTDGVNVSQLKAAQAAAKTEVKGTGLATVGTPTKGANGQDVYTVDVAKAKAPTVTDGKVSVDADDAGKVMVAGDVVNAINGSGFTLTTSASGGEVSGTSKELVNPGKTVTIDAGKNIKLAQAAGKITVATQDDVAFNSVTAKTVTADTVSATTVQAGDTTVDNSGVTINNGTAGIPVTLTKDGLNNGGNRITNVAPGVEDTDAVNIGQLKAANANVHNRIDGVESNANAGVAQAMATAGLPQAYLPGKSMMAIGGGVYRGETGYAIGFSSISDGGNWIVKGTASGNSRGNYGATAAVGYQW